MSEDGLNPRETILRMCAAAAPEPWYPRLYVKHADIDAAALSECLEELWLDGLIQKTPGNAETGPAISLTHAGERVLLDPEALERLRSGQPLSAQDRGAIVRGAFRDRMIPHITRLIVLVHVVVFAHGYLDARQIGAGKDFLSAPPVTAQVAKLLEDSGQLSARNLIDGQWWRLLTAGFVHVGFLYLLLNMVFLYLAGRYVERMWGHVRYLLIYLISMVGCSCVGVVQNLTGEASAAGSVCGLLGAEAVWFLFNRRYLPRSLMRAAWWSLISSGVFLVVILLFSEAGRWGLLGGTIAGALAGLLLHLHRFGPPLWRWLAIAGFVPLAWYGHHLIDFARATDERWQKIEDQQFEERYAAAIGKAMKQAKTIYTEQVTTLLRWDPADREPEKVESVLPLLVQQQHELNALADRLDRAGPYGSTEAELARRTGREYVRAGAKLFTLAEQVLRLGEQWTDKDRQALRQQQSEIDKLHNKWRALVE